MKHWFETAKEARKVAAERNKTDVLGGHEVFKWKHTKRQKPFFVGRRIEWLNVG